MWLFRNGLQNGLSKAADLATRESVEWMFRYSIIEFRITPGGNAYFYYTRSLSQLYLVRGRQRERR